MKKISCVLLALILTLTALSACHQGDVRESTVSYTSTSTAITESTTEPETVTEAVTQAEIPAEKQLAIKFLDYLKNKDEVNIIKLIVNPFTGFYSDDPSGYKKVMKAYSFFRKIYGVNYKITKEKRMSDYTRYTIILNITKSGTSLFPAGTSKWILEIYDIDSDYDYPIKTFELASIPSNATLNKSQSDVYDLCYIVSTMFHCFKSVDDFNKLVPVIKKTDNFDDFDEFCFELAIVLPLPTIDGVKPELIASQAKKVLGITGIDFKKCQGYDAKEDLVYFGGRCCERYFSSLNIIRFNSATRQYSVIIDYYSDSVYLLKAKSIKYIVRKNKDKSLTLLSNELLYDSGVTLASFYA